jgi:hypothetical protein
MLSEYKKMKSDWLLDEIIKEANTVEWPSDSRLLSELRSELLIRIAAAERERDQLCFNCHNPLVRVCAICGAAAEEYDADACQRCGGRGEVRNDGFVWVTCPVCDGAAL